VAPPQGNTTAKIAWEKLSQSICGNGNWLGGFFAMLGGICFCITRKITRKPLRSYLIGKGKYDPKNWKQKISAALEENKKESRNFQHSKGCGKSRKASGVFQTEKINYGNS
jgi:hypothetical protein